jgi:triphosphoribosyl-dephospho-CoA synthetase
MYDKRTDKDVAQKLMEAADWSTIGMDQPSFEPEVAEEVIEEETADEVETKEDETEIQEGKDEAEEHTCPLCESVLEEAISDEKIQEHVNLISKILEEAAVEDDEAGESDDD